MPEKESGLSEESLKMSIVYYTGLLAVSGAFSEWFIKGFIVLNDFVYQYPQAERYLRRFLNNDLHSFPKPVEHAIQFIFDPDRLFINGAGVMLIAVAAFGYKWVQERRLRRNL